MINNLKYPNILIFVFGTLRQGDRLAYYMSGSISLGLHYTRGQLMVAESGSTYIDFSEQDAYTIGELHIINYAGLQRINHLESRSGEFPKRYNLSLVKVKPYHEGQIIDLDNDLAEIKTAFFYKRQNEPLKIESGDWLKRSKPMHEIKTILENEKMRELESHELIFRMKERMEIN